MNIGLSVVHHAGRTPDAVAVDDDGHRQLTYAELDSRSSRLAHCLRERFGVRPGDRVGYLLYNRLEVVEILVACAKLGAIAAPMNFRLTESDLRATFTNAEPRVVLTECELAEVVHTVAGELGFAVLVVDTGDYTLATGTGSPAAPGSVLTTGGTADALIQYTSGTTGLPKGATFTHNAVLMHAANVALEYDVDAASRVMISIPHNSGTNIQIIPALYRGATVVLTDARGFDGARWLERVGQLRVTHSQVVPTMLYRVLEVARRTRPDLSCVRRLGYGSAPMSPERVAELIELFGTVFIQLYGMVEIAAIGTMLRPAEHEMALAGRPELLGSVGRSSYGIDVRILDEQGNYRCDGGRGEVVFTGPYVMRGYWNAPDRTAEAIRDGWMHSGDVAELRDGWFFLVDRIKDLIIRGGQNIASKEIEEALYHHPSVMEAAVVGVPDPEWGEQPVASVVCRPGTTATEEEVLAAARTSGLARFKCPTRIEFVAELPRNAIGKIQKGVLRERHRAAGAGSDRG